MFVFYCFDSEFVCEVTVGIQNDSISVREMRSLRQANPSAAALRAAKAIIDAHREAFRDARSDPTAAELAALIDAEFAPVKQSRCEYVFWSDAISGSRHALVCSLPKGHTGDHVDEAVEFGI